MRLSPLSLYKLFGLRRLVQILFYLPSFAKVFSRLIQDARVPLGPKMLLFVVFAYLVIPADLFPDFLLGLGQVDDLLVVLLGCRLFLRLCPKDVVQEHVQAIAAGR